MKILLIGCDTKAITSHVGTVFKYKHENHGIKMVPSNANLEKLFTKTEATVIITPSTSVFCRQVNGGDKYSEKLINLLRDKNITIIANDMLSTSDIGKVFDAALSTAYGHKDVYVVDKYSRTYKPVNQYTIDYINVLSRTDINICETIEDAKAKVIELTKAKIKQYGEFIKSAELNIKDYSAKIVKLQKSLEGK